MKLNRFFIILLIPVLLFSQCRKHTTKDQLPPETQTGAGTVGFKIDNTIYKANSPDAFSTYIQMSFPFPYGNGYFFTAGVNVSTWNIGILTDSLLVSQGQTYPLNNNQSSKGQAYASFASGGKIYHTKPYLSGQMSVTKLDSINQIILGTFWFDAIDTLSNTIVQVREGRFDLHYTR